jgi:peptidoglycan-N-acetylglucosamine deacetylase
MKKYFIKTPGWLQKLFSSFTWKINTEEKIVYLTFDDGPHPLATPFVLDELKKANATATFFCIGKNVIAYPEIYRRILDEGHAVGNHTQNHLNGWKENDRTYLLDVAEASKYIDSNLFRPPYGKITPFQAKNISSAMHASNTEIIMWDVLSADFDPTFSAMDCIEHVIKNTGNGSIVVFHDSEKAFSRLAPALPVILNEMGRIGFVFKKIKGKYVKA